MTSGYILIVAILVLGGVIATVGDRLGTRVGKARLSLFNMRPRQTAVLITIITGGIISASTLAILFAISDQLRTGVFELGRIQDNLSKARKELDQTRTQKGQVESELTTAKTENSRIKTENSRIEIENSRIRAEYARIAAEKARARAENARLAIENSRIRAESARIAAEKARTQEQLKIVSQQEAALQKEIKQLQVERNEAIAQRDADIAARDQVIAQSATRLKELELQRANLENAVQALDVAYQYYQDKYRAVVSGNVVLLRGQVLASGVVRILTPTAARQAVDQLLREANRIAIQQTQPGANPVNQQAIQITRAQVEQLVNQIQDGQDYVLRVLSAGNYLLGQTDIQVIANATVNRVVFQTGEVVASASVDLSGMTDEQIRERVEWLITASDFRGRGAGVMFEGVQVGDSTVLAIINFIEQLKQLKQPVDIQAVAAEAVYTAGPLKIQLVAIQDGQVIFRTG